MNKNDFLNKANAIGASKINWLVVAIKMPNGAIELISNSHGIEDKIAYYKKAYDDNLHLKTCPDIHIIDFMIV